MAEPENPFEKYVTPSAVAPVPVGPEVNPFAKYVTPDVSVQRPPQHSASAAQASPSCAQKDGRPEQRPSAQ